MKENLDSGIWQKTENDLTLVRNILGNWVPRAFLKDYEVTFSIIRAYFEKYGCRVECAKTTSLFPIVKIDGKEEFYIDRRGAFFNAEHTSQVCVEIVKNHTDLLIFYASKKS